MAKKSLLAMGVVLFTILVGLSVWAAPLYFNYQGRLVDRTSGEPVDGTVDMTFSIYDGDGGSANLLWQEEHTGVAVDNGIYNVHLGSGTTTVGVFDPDLFADDNRWLEVVVNGERLLPRQQCTSVAYSLSAADADTLDGMDSSEFAGSSHYHSFGEIIGTATDAQIPNNITINYAATAGDAASADSADFATNAENADMVDGHHAGDFAEDIHQHSGTDITSGTVADARIAASIARDSEIMPTVLASDGSGSGLDADMLDGQQGSSFLSSSSDYGRSGVASNLYEGTTSLANKYVKKAGDTMAGPLSVPSLQIDGTAAFVLDNTNLFLGHGAGVSNTTGTANTFIGLGVGYFNETQSSNTFVGMNAGYNNKGDNNTFIGALAGTDHSIGWANTFVGMNAGRYHDEGWYNTFIGQAAGWNNQTGGNNTFIGSRAGLDNNGHFNVFLGRDAGRNETGSNKLYIANSNTDTPLIYGEFDYNLLTFHGNVGIGTKNPSEELHIYGVNPRILIEATSINPEINFKNADDLSDEVWALYKYKSGDNNDLRFYQGFDRITIKGGSGNVGIGTAYPGDFKLAVNGNAAKPNGGSWSTFSDVRLKDIGERYEHGLEEITKIHPVKYRYKEENALGLPSGEESVGLIAQEVQEVIPEAVEQNEQGYLMLKGDPINYAMLNAIKELSAEVKRLKKRIEELEKR